jgi:hypothetical protein
VAGTPFFLVNHKLRAGRMTALYIPRPRRAAGRIRSAGKEEITMAEDTNNTYEAPVLTVLGTLTDLTKGSSLNIVGDALLQASASIISII